MKKKQTKRERNEFTGCHGWVGNDRIEYFHRLDNITLGNVAN